MTDAKEKKQGSLRNAHAVTYIATAAPQTAKSSAATAPPVPMQNAINSPAWVEKERSDASTIQPSSAKNGGNPNTSSRYSPTLSATSTTAPPTTSSVLRRFFTPRTISA